MCFDLATTTISEVMTMTTKTANADHDAEAFIAAIDPSTMRDGIHLRRIAAAKEAVERDEAELTAAVVAAREAGDSWTMIGLMLGTSKQNAHRKYGHIA